MTTTFASLVKNAAEKTPAAGRFAGKVWIHAAWAIGGFEMSLTEFKRHLLDANRAGELSLSRCDLAEAADPRDVRRACTPSQGFEFHLIRV